MSSREDQWIDDVGKKINGLTMSVKEERLITYKLMSVFITSLRKLSRVLKIYVSGYHNGNCITRKVIDSNFYWTSIFQDHNDFVRRCYRCQHTGNICNWNEMPQIISFPVEFFDVWSIHFIWAIFLFPTVISIFLLLWITCLSGQKRKRPTNNARTVGKFIQRPFKHFSVPWSIIRD